MKILLVAVNAKYIHSNLGIYSLKAYGNQMLLKKAQSGQTTPSGSGTLRIDLAEYTINQQPDDILSDIYR